MSADHPDRGSLTATAVPMPRHGEKPVAAGKVLGAYLRRLRKERGMALKDAAPVIRASVSKISRMERGENPPRERDVLDLLNHYGVKDVRQVQAIRDLLRQATATAWYDEYSDVTPGWLKRLIGLEDSATEIRTYEVNVVPGLLQTPSYARAVVKSGRPHDSDTETERRVALRIARQKLLDGTSSLQLVALLDESILRRPVGGREVMAEQLQYLLHVAERSRITIRIVQFTKSAQIAPTTPITYLKFAPGGPTELIYLENAIGATYVTNHDDVERYRLLLSELWGVAESRKDTMRLLREAQKGYAAHPSQHC